MKHSLLEMSEETLIKTLKDLKEMHNNLQQQTYKFRERINLFQAQLLKVQRERIMAANARKLDTSALEAQSGLSREEILKAILLIKQG